MLHQTEIRQAQETMEGEGVDVKRLMPIPGFMNYDPFVLWDHFNIVPGSGFPDHPHRGFEAITYLFNGSMQHTDNLGNCSTVLAGEAQRFTAGRGLVHSEMPGQAEHTTGIQLWINLPQRLKTVEPAYQQVNAEAMPQQIFPGGKKRIIVGEGSPLKLLTPVTYQDIELSAKARLSEPVVSGYRGLVYIVDGALELNGHELKMGQAYFGEAEGLLDFKAIQNTRFMLCFGQAHGEPIRQHGSFVD